MLVNISAKDIEMSKIREEVLIALNSDNEPKLIKVKKTLEKMVKNKYSSVRASYLGSVTAKMARYSFFPWSKISYAKAGSKLLDKAVKEDENNPTIRLNRFSSYIRYPDSLKKRHYVQRDARWFLKNLQEKTLKKIFIQYSYQVLSMFFLKQEDNKRYIKYFSKLKDKNMIEIVKKFELSLNK